MDLEQHLGRLGALLDIERAAEVERFAAYRERLSLREREARGILLADVEAIEEGGLAGRSLVTYARPGGRELGGSEIGAGSIVRVVQRREQPDAHGQSDYHFLGRYAYRYLGWDRFFQFNRLDWIVPAQCV